MDDSNPCPNLCRRCAVADRAINTRQWSRCTNSPCDDLVMNEIGGDRSICTSADILHVHEQQQQQQKELEAVISSRRSYVNMVDELHVAKKKRLRLPAGSSSNANSTHKPIEVKQAGIVWDSSSDVEKTSVKAAEEEDVIDEEGDDQGTSEWGFTTPPRSRAGPRVNHIDKTVNIGPSGMDSVSDQLHELQHEREMKIACVQSQIFGEQDYASTFLHSYKMSCIDSRIDNGGGDNDELCDHTRSAGTAQYSMSRSHVRDDDDDGVGINGSQRGNCAFIDHVTQQTGVGCVTKAVRYDRLVPPPAPRKPKTKPRMNHILHKNRPNFFIPPDLELFFTSISSSL